MSQLRDPIAIVGIGCRFPGGGRTPESFWQSLVDKTDGIIPVPADRWDAESFYHPDLGTRGKMNVKEGGFIQDVDKFDAQFFGISPVEAAVMDPQQRLLLVHTFMAFEDAGLTLEGLRGSSTGVFVGISSTDYAAIQNAVTERNAMGPHSNTGNAASIAANRISYVFDLKGPSFAVDTACSSGLVATHLACRSIWSGESQMAVVGAVNLMLRPELHIGFSTGGFLSPDARSKTFDAEADGYVRSEGVGAVVLKPLRRALADGDRIYATILGSAINQDGRTDGIAHPSSKAQIAAIRAAYEDAGIDPGLVSYIEAHGTGTAVGDPIECSSIGEVIGRRREAPCLVGSVKSNIGHLEPASGLAGLIKVALSLKSGRVPPNINFKKPNPKIDFDKLNLSVPLEVTELAGSKAGIFAGINSFGFGGANAHVVLKSFDDPERETHTQIDKGGLLVLSARSEDALKDLARSYATLVESRPERFADICGSAATRRSALEVRAAVVADDSQSGKERLLNLADGTNDPLVSLGRPVIKPVDKTAFVFSGQGPQWFAMGRELLEKNEIFKDTVVEIDGILSDLGWLKGEGSSLLKELKKDEQTSRMNETHVVQPALFALQVGLARIWRSMGVNPQGAVGHSIGEVAAGWASGALSLEEAAKVVFWRSRCQSKAAGRGRMLAVGLPVVDAEKAIAPFAGKIDIAAVNGKEMVTVAGDTDALDVLADELEKKGVFQRFLVVDVPFHCYLLDDVARDFVEQTPAINSSAASIDIYSTVTAGRLDGESMTSGYWARNIRQTVLFYPTVSKMVEDGYKTFIEISPHPILAGGMNAALKEAGTKGVVVPSLRRKEPEWNRLRLSLGELFIGGLDVDWRSFFGDSKSFVSLPHYPWQEESHWRESGLSKRLRLGKRAHPHLKEERRTNDPSLAVIWDVELDRRSQPYIGDHRVQGPLVYPGAGHVDLALGVARASFGDDFGFLENIFFFDPLFLEDDGDPTDVQIQVTSDEGRYEISSSRGDGSWKVHSSGKINHIGDSFETEPVDMDAARKRIAEPVDIERLHSALNRGGLNLGDTFRGISKLFQGRGESWGEIRVHPSIRHDQARFNLHPALLDAAFQTAFGMIANREEIGVYIPVEIERVKFHGSPCTDTISTYTRSREQSDDYLGADIWIFDAKDRLLAEVQGFKAKYLKGSRGEVKGEIDNWLYKYRWVAKERADQEANRRPEEYLASFDLTQSSMRDYVEELKKEPHFHSYFEEFSPAADELADHYMARALEELGFDFETGKIIRPSELASSLGIIDKHEALFNRILEHLTNAGVFTQMEGGLKVVAKPANNKAEDIVCKIKDKAEAFDAELALITAAGPALAKVMRGELDPVEVLFSEADWSRLLAYYSKSQAFDKYNRMLGRCMEALASKVPSGKTLRVLEIGAGTGGVTKEILDHLPAQRCEYVFTDLSPMFLDKARERFFDRQFVTYRQLDIEKDVEAQGETLHSYDIVIASNVIHATKRIDETLNQVTRLLADGGAFIMLEVTRPPKYLDLIFGLTEGWWRFDDRDLRPDHCALTPSKWSAALTGAGFEDVRAVSDVDDLSGLVQQTVFLARNTKISPLPKLVEKVEPGSYVLFADQEGHAVELKKRLEALGDSCFLVRKSSALEKLDNRLFAAPVDDKAAMAAVLDEARAHGPLKGIVHMWSLDLPDIEAIPKERVKEELVDMAYSAVAIASVMAQEGSSPAPLWFVTHGAMKVLNSDSVNLAQSPLLGLGRVVMNETPALNPRLVDLEKRPESNNVEMLLSEMTQTAGDLRDEEVAFRDGLRFVHVLTRVNRKQAIEEARTSMPGSGSDYRLTAGGSGLIDDIDFVEKPLTRPESDEVLIAVRAAGLNFRDVMNATSMLPEDALDGGLFGTGLGLECTGEVLEVGEDVTEFSKGDRVMGFARETISGAVTTKAALIKKTPGNLSPEKAASIPMAYVTAYYGLKHLARLKKGERVLIHSGAGGVGLAAVALAKLIGAEVFATASPGKHDFVKKLGASRVFNSRATDYRDELMSATDGRGVDVVLNSLSGSHVIQSVKCLAPCGRFVEIGKTDVYSNKQLPLRLIADNISYCVADIDRLLVQKPDLMSACLAEVNEMFSSGRLALPKTEVFKVSKAKEAMKKLARAEHVGKLVVSMDDTVRVSRTNRLNLSSDSCYLIAGGTDGFGLLVAAFLAERGARNLALMSRSGLKGDAERESVRQLEELGCAIQIIKGDVSSYSDVERAVASCHCAKTPLRGVFQSTLALSDSPFLTMSHQGFAVPFAPKVAGTWNLHMATREIPLDHFVSFSSIASMYGTPGQGNYAAANSFLDMFSHYRRAKGLQASTISWGVLGEVGFVHRTKKVRDFLSNHGWDALKPAQALEVLERVMTERPIHVGAFKCDWASINTTFPHNGKSRRFSRLHCERDGAGLDGAGGNLMLKDRLAKEPREKWQSLLTEGVSEMMSKIVGIAAQKIDVHLPITRMGLDSLMANQVRSWLTSQTGAEFSLMQIMRGPTVEELAMEIAQAVERQSTTLNLEAVDESEKWAVAPRKLDKPKLRLFCFPYLGAGASVFSGWHEHLPEGVEIRLIQLPGREERTEESAISDGMELFEKLGRAIAPLLDVPYIFYGHSFGGNIAMGFAAYLDRTVGRGPEHVFVGAAIAPGVDNPLDAQLDKGSAGDPEKVSNEALIELLKRLGAPTSLLGDSESLNRMIPAIRGDLQITSQRLIPKDMVLSCPVTVIAGRDDEIYSAGLLANWKTYTSTFDQKVVPGGHLFIHNSESRAQVLKMIGSALG